MDRQSTDRQLQVYSGHLAGAQTGQDHPSQRQASHPTGILRWSSSDYPNGSIIVPARSGFMTSSLSSPRLSPMALQCARLVG